MILAIVPGDPLAAMIEKWERELCDRFKDDLANEQTRADTERKIEQELITRARAFAFELLQMSDYGLIR